MEQINDAEGLSLPRSLSLSLCHTHSPDILTLLSCLILFLITAFTIFFPSCVCGKKPVIYLASQPTSKLRPSYAEASPEKCCSAVCLLICLFANGLWSFCTYTRWHSAQRSLPSRVSVAKQRAMFETPTPLKPSVAKIWKCCIRAALCLTCPL